MDTISKAMEYVRLVHSPYLGVYPDLGNLTNAAELYNLDVATEILDATGHLFAMHLKETVPGRYRDMRFGEGRVDFVSGIRAALRAGVRCFVAEYWHQDGSDFMEQIREINRFLRERFAMAE